MADLTQRPSTYWHPIRRNRFDSALVVLLGLHLFPRLDPGDQQRVENLLIDDFHKCPIPYTVFRQDAGASSDVVAYHRAMAMARLGMPTGIAGLEWKEFAQLSWLGPSTATFNDFRRFDAQTDAAADFLRSNGLALDERTAQGRRWMDEMQARYP